MVDIHTRVAGCAVGVEPFLQVSVRPAEALVHRYSLEVAGVVACSSYAGEFNSST